MVIKMVVFYVKFKNKTTNLYSFCLRMNVSDLHLWWFEKLMDAEIRAKHAEKWHHVKPMSAGCFNTELKPLL